MPREAASAGFNLELMCLQLVVAERDWMNDTLFATKGFESPCSVCDVT